MSDQTVIHDFDRLCFFQDDICGVTAFVTSHEHDKSYRLTIQYTDENTAPDGGDREYRYSNVAAAMLHFSAIVADCAVNIATAV